MNNSRIISLVVMFIIFVILSLMPILTGKSVLRSKKGRQEKFWQHEIHQEDAARLESVSPSILRHDFDHLTPNTGDQ